MLGVALTGNVASGKSAVARRWEEWGVPVVRADDLAREAVAPGSAGLAAVVDAFGSDVLAADGSLDRGRMRARVFSDEHARARLESIVHPEVWALRARWLEARRAEGAALVVSEIPLLYETGREGDFDLVVFVDAPEGVRLGRMTADRGLSEEEARRMIAAQMDPAMKRERADHVLAIDGTLDALDAEADRLLFQLRAQAGITDARMDLHLHTVGSFDSLSDPERVLEAALGRGYRRIAMTDHNRIHVAAAMAERHPGRVIVGEEVKTAEGVDVIGLYLRQEIPKGTPAEETIDRIHDQGGIAYLPHPYAGGKGGGGRLADRLGSRCDVVEIFNARLHSATANDRAEALATRLGKARGAGSDAHTLAEIGNAWVDLPRHPDRPELLLRALSYGRPGGREASRLVHLGSTWAKVRKRLPAPPGHR